MKKNWHLPYLFLLSFFFLNNGSFSQGRAFGIFDGSNDVGGDSVKKGSVIYVPETSQYVVTGSGYNIWFDHDEFRFVWKRLKGDFILYARAGFEGNGVEAHRKMGWMIRKTLKGNSSEVLACIHGDGLTSLQYRKAEGINMEEARLSITHADVLQLERKGNRFIMRAARFGEPFVTQEVSEIDLGDEVYVGLFVCSHNPAVSETAIFRNVKITVAEKRPLGK
jgi:hypothetical protein